MARYIDLEELEKRIKKYVKPEIPEEKAFVEYYKDECIRQAYAMPAADVVPKRQYDLAVAEREANVKGFAEELAKAKAEAAREIFAELESVLCSFEYPSLTALGKINVIRADGWHIRADDYRTIKKKYITERE